MAGVLPEIVVFVANFADHYAGSVDYYVPRRNYCVHIKKGAIVIQKPPIIMMNEDQLNHLKNLIANDDLEESIERLNIFLENSSYMDEALSLSGRFQALRKQVRLGLIESREASSERNQIRAAILSLLQEIEHPGKGPESRNAKTDLSKSPATNTSVIGSVITAGGNVEIGDRTIITETKFTRRLQVSLLILVPALAILLAIIWSKWKNLQTPRSLKVRIENKSRNTELPPPDGNLELILGSKTETRNHVGTEAFYEGIPANFWNEEIHLKFTAAGFNAIDTTFNFKINTIDLVVTRNDDLAYLAGAVTDEEDRPLERVVVSLDCCMTQTDATGNFSLYIPPDFQRLNQQVTISKPGFLVKKVNTPVKKGEKIDLVLYR